MESWNHFLKKLIKTKSSKLFYLKYNEMYKVDVDF